MKALIFTLSLLTFTLLAHNSLQTLSFTNSIQDVACQQKKELFSNLGTQKIRRFTHEGWKEENYPFGDDKHQKLLQQFIKRVIYYDQQTPTKESFEGESKQNILNFAQKNYPELQFCQNSPFFGHYDFDSFEGMALSTIANLLDSYDHYQSVLTDSTRKDTIRPITLLVGPKYNIKGHSLTDNVVFEKENMSDMVIAFLPSDAGTKAITNSPSATSKSSKPIPLWEQQFIIAHEFGHVVFDKYGISLNPKDKRFSLIALALHECFADLWAIISSGGYQVAITKGVDAARNPLNPIHSPQLTKGLYPKYFVKTQLIPELREQHLLGSFMVYGFYNIIQNTLDKNNDKDKDKAKFLLAWAKEIEKASPIITDLTHTDLEKLRIIVISFCATLEKFVAIKPDHLRLLEQHFPVFKFSV